MTTETLQEMWIKRADEVLNSGRSGPFGSEAVQCAASMLSAFYGPESAQMKTYRATMDVIAKGKDSQFNLRMNALGTIKNIRGELSAGLVKSVRALVAGEMLAELLGLAKEILAEPQDPEVGKNVGAVLIAAAFEDLLRRMGSELAGVTDRPKLEKVINSLKEKGVLKGGEPAMAQGYLKFRNDSLHADWNQVQRSQVDGCLALVESLLGKHFS